MKSNSADLQSTIENSNSYLALITCLISHILILDSENSQLKKENLRISREYEIYKARHPQKVGVKHGKAYELKQFDENKTTDQNKTPPKKEVRKSGTKNKSEKNTSVSIKQFS